MPTCNGWNCTRTERICAGCRQCNYCVTFCDADEAYCCSCLDHRWCEAGDHCFSGGDSYCRNCDSCYDCCSCVHEEESEGIGGIQPDTLENTCPACGMPFNSCVCLHI